MLTPRHFAALLLLVNAVVLSTQGGQAQPRATVARSSVDAWLSLVDRARAEDVRAGAGPERRASAASRLSDFNRSTSTSAFCASRTALVATAR